MNVVRARPLGLALLGNYRAAFSSAAAKMVTARFQTSDNMRDRTIASTGFKIYCTAGEEQ